MRIFDLGEGRFIPIRREIEDRGRRRRSDGTYMGYGYGPEMHREKMRELDRRERDLEERERRLEERQRAHEREDRAYRRIGYVVPEDCYGEDCDEYYEGDFRIVRGREY